MESFDASGVTGIVWRRVEPAQEALAEKLMRELMLLSRKEPGYLGSEIFPPIPGVQDAYVVLYRFDRGEHLRRWLRSVPRAHLLARLEKLLLEPSFEFFFAHRRRAAGSASTILSYRLKPGVESGFHEWQMRMQEATRAQPGFLGIEIYDSLDDEKRPEMVVMVRFENRTQLDAWQYSKIRAKLLEEGQAYMEDHRIRRIGSGFEGWFDVSEDRSPPAKWRQGLVILSMLFPVIMILRVLFAPLFTVLAFPLAFLILLVVDVAILTYLIMPYYSRMLDFWLRPDPQRAWSRELLGWFVVLILPAVTLAVSLWAEK